MIPIGCVHLKNMPNLNRICRKLDIDCVAAVVGFDAHGGFSHAVYDGWIICEEFKETVTLAYQEYEFEEAKKMIQKRTDKVIGNWKKLTKLLLLRERLKLKYETKTSVFNKIDKHGNGLSKCLNEDEKIDPKTAINNIDTGLVGSKLNKDNNNNRVDLELNLAEDRSETRNTKETAFLRGSNKSKTNSAKTSGKKAKPIVKMDLDPCSDSDPEFDFKDIVKSRRQKNPVRNSKKKTIVESEEEILIETTNSEPIVATSSTVSGNKLDEFGDVNLSESDDDSNTVN